MITNALYGSAVYVDEISADELPFYAAIFTMTGNYMDEYLDLKDRLIRQMSNAAEAYNTAKKKVNYATLARSILTDDLIVIGNI